MQTTRARTVTLLAASFFLLAAGNLTAQVKKWEAGISGGGSLYQEKSFSAPAGSAKTGFKTSYAVGGWIGNDLFKYVSGEIRYMFAGNSAKLSAEGLDSSFGARSHAIHYDILIHTSGNGSSVRPFFSVGGGAKGFFGTGNETASQPLQDYAILTKTSEWKPLVTFGGGVKIKLSDSVQLRVEVKDYLSQFPTKVIFPANGADLGGWVHNLVPMVGIGFTF
jgi:uncharacterized protein YfiM (DUF2279 family)